MRLKVFKINLRRIRFISSPKISKNTWKSNTFFSKKKLVLYILIKCLFYIERSLTRRGKFFFTLFFCCSSNFLLNFSNFLKQFYIFIVKTKIFIFQKNLQILSLFKKISSKSYNIAPLLCLEISYPYLLIFWLIQSEKYEVSVNKL